MSSADESVETRRVCWAISPLNDYISIIFHEEYDHNAVIVSDFRFSLYWGRPSSRRVVKYLQDGEPLCMLTPNTHSKGENIRVHVVDLTQFDFFMKSPDVNIQAICQGSDCMWTWFKTCTDMLEAMDQDSSLGLPLEDDITRDIEAQGAVRYSPLGFHDGQPCYSPTYEGVLAEIPDSSPTLHFREEAGGATQYFRLPSAAAPAPVQEPAADVHESSGELTVILRPASPDVKPRSSKRHLMQALPQRKSNRARVPIHLRRPEYEYSF